MNHIQRIRRAVVTLAGLACAWLGLAVAAPSAFAMRVPDPGGTGSVPASGGPDTDPSSAAVTVTRTVLVGGMPGWQIALIALGAAVVAAG